MNAKISVFVIYVEANIYLLSYNLHDCTFNILDTEHLVIVDVYADDLLIVSNEIQLLAVKKRKTSDRFDIDDQGEVHDCLDLPIKQNRKEGVLKIDQRACLTDVLKRYGMGDCKTYRCTTGTW